MAKNRDMRDKPTRVLRVIRDMPKSAGFSESERSAAQKELKRRARASRGGCAVTAIAAGVSLAGAIATLRGWV